MDKAGKGGTVDLNIGIGAQRPVSFTTGGGKGGDGQLHSSWKGEVGQPHFWEQEETVAFSWREGRSTCNFHERDGKGSCNFQGGGKRCLAALWVRVGLDL